MTEELWQATRVAIQELCDAFVEGKSPSTLYRHNEVVRARLEQLMEETAEDNAKAARGVS